MKRILFICLVFSMAWAQNPNRKYLSHLWSKDQLEVKTSDGIYIFSPYASDIINTSFYPNNGEKDLASHAVVMKPENFKKSFSETSNNLILNTPSIQLLITKNPFQVSYLNKRGHVIISEKEGYQKKDSTHYIRLNIDKTEALYGGGERVLGMNRRGNKLELYNRAHYGYSNRAELMNFCMPLVYSSKRYAVHFDNASVGKLDLDSKKDNTLAFETQSGKMSYQVIVGKTWKKLIDNYTTLTGKQPLIPRWALGNFSSRFGYHTQEETEKTIQAFRNEKIPVDAIILDLFWFGKTVQGTMGNLSFDKENFPAPQKMIDNLNKQKIKTILITEPFILTNSSRWQEAVDQNILATNKAGKPFTYDFYFGNTGLIDIFKPESKKWFWGTYKDLINKGVSGLWGDLGEPEVHPKALQHINGSADQVHNIYGHTWAEMIQQGYKNDFPQQRPFILMRAGYSGSQRFGMIPWSGDVGRTWESLYAQIEIATQMGMQGMGYMHSDLGGFAGDETNNELYTRWLQFGVFSPIFRPHAQEIVPSEPVFREPTTKDLAKKSIELRYQLLPYNYNLAFENSQNGTPLMRPLFFEDPNNKDLLNHSDSYFWGNDFLIAPVTKPGIKSQKVYFPKNQNWFDFYTDKIYQAGSNESVDIHLDHIPTFVKAGAIIPMTPVVQSTEDYNASQLILHYFADASIKNTTRNMYHDDGKTPNAYEKGLYQIFQFQASNTQNIALDVQATLGKNAKPSQHSLTFVIHNIQEKPDNLMVNNKKTAFNYNPESKQITFKTNWKSNTKLSVFVQK